MPYNIEIIRRQEQTTSNWSGGTTTQIVIYPKQANYAKRNFIWRISSARVELEESEFTSLPGIRRLIMVLDGEMRLEHAAHHSCHLQAFDQDSFSGDWTTKSYGKVRDFNLMLRGSSTGQLTALALPEKTSRQIDIHSPKPDGFPHMTSAFYCVDGTLTISILHDKAYELTAGDVLLITTHHDHGENLSATLTNTAHQPLHIIKTEIEYL